jgi:hypothetical protein
MMHKTMIATALLLSATAASPTWAHGPTRQKVTESVAIAASPDAVWKRIKDFDALHSWHPAVASTATTTGNTVGSVRTLQLRGGGTIIEELTRYSAEARSFAYRMTDPGPLPVTNYTSTLSVNAGADGSSVVEWRGAFYRGDPNGNPPPEKNDEAAIAAVTGVYKAGLENLKLLVEGK